MIASETFGSVLMDKALKQRMVGASVLIALAVIVLPMLLGGRPDGEIQPTRKIELPAQPPELNFETRRYPIGEQRLENQQKEEESGQLEPARPLPAPKAQLGPLKQAKAVDSSSDAQTSTPATASPALVQPASSPDTGRYIVQVASFGTLANANKLSATLRSNGYTVMTDSVKSDVGILHRVRVGPYVSQVESNGIVAELESRISGIKPRVMDLQPQKNAQITTPSDPLVRWIVQVGSFSSAANAEKLVASLRLDGLSAYQETVSSSGSSIYRVRIGPYLQREEAIRIESQVQEKRSLDGVVMSAD
jgi:DedD protein